VTDFAGGDYSNNADNIGADFFIDAGQRMLDRKASYIKAYMWYKKNVTSGTYKLKFQQAASVKEVWIMSETYGRYQLRKKAYEWIRNNYGDPYSDITPGKTLYYSPLVMSLSPEQSALKTTDYSSEFTMDFEEITFADEAEHYDYRGILLMPPPEELSTVSILGRFRSRKLTSDSVKTFWTEVHPDLLVLAAMWALERFERNREGMSDYMSAIEESLFDLGKDMVEEEVQDLDEMEG